MDKVFTLIATLEGVNLTAGLAKTIHDFLTFLQRAFKLKVCLRVGNLTRLFCLVFIII